MTPADVTALAHAGIHRFPAGWSWSFREHPLPWQGYILGTVLSGTGAIDSHGADPSQEIPTGTCYWLPLATPQHRLRNTGPSPLVLAWLNLETTPHAHPPLRRRPANFPLWEQLIHRVIQCWQQSDRSAARHWLDACLCELTWPQLPPASVTDESNDLHATRLEALCRRIRESPGETWTVARMAREVHLSIPQLNRLFPRYHRLSPQRFIIRTRLETARTYLETTDYSVSHIADILGYADPFVFSRQFKREIGRSPALHRQHQQNGGRKEPPLSTR